MNQALQSPEDTLPEQLATSCSTPADWTFLIISAARGAKIDVVRMDKPADRMTIFQGSDFSQPVNLYEGIYQAPVNPNSTAIRRALEAGRLLLVEIYGLVGSPSVAYTIRRNGLDVFNHTKTSPATQGGDWLASRFTLITATRYEHLKEESVATS